VRSILHEPRPAGEAGRQSRIRPAESVPHPNARNFRGGSPLCKRRPHPYPPPLAGEGVRRANGGRVGGFEATAIAMLFI